MKTLKEILADRRSENEKIIRAAQVRVEEALLDMCYGMVRLCVAESFFYLKVAEGEKVEVYPDKIRVYTEDRHRAEHHSCFEWENAEVFRKLLEWEFVEMDNSMSVLAEHPLLGFAERLDNKIRFGTARLIDDDGTRVCTPVSYDDDDIPF